MSKSEKIYMKAIFLQNRHFTAINRFSEETRVNLGTVDFTEESINSLRKYLIF
jgi:hypothetical protein